MENLLNLLDAAHYEDKRNILDKMKKSDIVELIIKQGYKIKSDAEGSEENKKRLNDQNSSHNVMKRMMFGFLGYDILSDRYYASHDIEKYDAIGLMGQVLATADSSKFTAPEKAKD